MTEERKLVVITGVTRGLGRALAVGISGAGHQVVGCGRDEVALETLRKTLGEGAEGVGGPVSRRAFAGVDVRTTEVESWGRSIVSEFGAPDLLITNAGLIHRSAPVWELETEEMLEVIDTNVGGVLRTVRAFLPAMVDRGTGVVALLSSGWGRSVSPGVATYCASKWAMEGFARALAAELPQGMASVAVNPGIIDTEMLRSAFGASASSYPDPETWSAYAVPFFLGLNKRDNGAALTVGGQS